MYAPVNPSFCCIKVGFKGVKTIQASFRYDFMKYDSFDNDISGLPAWYNDISGLPAWYNDISGLPGWWIAMLHFAFVEAKNRNILH